MTTSTQIGERMSDQHIEAAARAVFRDVTHYDLEQHDGSELDDSVWQDARRQSRLTIRAWLDSVDVEAFPLARTADAFGQDTETHAVLKRLAAAIRSAQQ